MSQEEIINIFNRYKLFQGRMISHSKSAYWNQYPDNEVIFNCNLATKIGKVWHGDLDLTVSKEELKNISSELGEPIYAFREMDYRFDNEKISLNEATHKANKYFVITPNNITKIQKEDYV